MVNGLKKPSIERVRDIKRLADQGWTAERIANKLKLNVHTVYGYANVNGIEIAKAPNPYHQDRAKVRAAIVAYARENPGLTRKAIAVKFGVAGPTVHRALAQVGLPTKRQYDAAGNLIDRPVKTE